MSAEAVLFRFLVSENELIAQEEKCKLASGQLTELFFRTQQEMVLERPFYSWLSGSWKILESLTLVLLYPDDGILVVASA